MKRLAWAAVLVAALGCRHEGEKAGGTAGLRRDGPVERSPAETSGDILQSVIKLASTTSWVCALSDSGAVYCWGTPWTTHGEMESVRSARPWRVKDLPPARDLQWGGESRTFSALTRAGETFRWGDAAPDYRRIPAPAGCTGPECSPTLEPLDPALDAHLAARLHPDEVWAMDLFGYPQSRFTIRAVQSRLPVTSGQFVVGAGTYGATGFRRESSFEPLATEEPVVGYVTLDRYESDYRCMVFRSGKVDCIPEPTPREKPPRVSFRLPAAVVGGGSENPDSFVFLLEGGRPVVWDESFKPYVHPDVTRLTQVDAEGPDFCGVRKDGDVICWRTRIDRKRTDFDVAPAVVEGAGPASQVEVGLLRACALQTNGTVKCWGKNEDGQCGTGEFSEKVERPTLVVSPRAGGV